MKIELNGRPREISPGTSIGELIVEVTGASRGSAAVIDGEIVPRSTWTTYTLADGQSVELITAVQGG